MILSTLIFFVLLAYIISSLFYKSKGILLCGIIGFSGPGVFDPNKIKSLFLYNANRGLDGYGMYNDGKITKDANDIYSAIPSLEIIPENIFIGHTRKSTYVNYKSQKHCHPFQYNNLIGVHNGTLTNHYQLTHNYDVKSIDFDTDTEMLYAVMSKDLDVLKQIKGTASLLFTYEDKPGVIYCFRRNEERPLFRGKCTEGLYVSSIEDSLKFIGCTDIEPFKIGYLYKIKDGKIETTRPFFEQTEKTKTVYNNFNNFEDQYTEEIFPETKHATLRAWRGEWVKITKNDATSNFENHNRVNVGRYYQLDDDLNYNGALYASLKLHIDRSGNPVLPGAKEHILWRIDCLELCKLPKIGDIVISMYDGKYGTQKGDVCLVTTIIWHGNKKTMEYEIVGPVPKKPAGKNPNFSWDYNNFRIASKEEIQEIYKKLGNKAHPGLAKAAGVMDVVSGSTNAEYLQNEAKIKMYEAITKKIGNLSAIDEESIIMHIRQKLLQGKSFADAVDDSFSIMSVIADGDEPTDGDQSDNTTKTEPEEEDITTDEDTPVDSATTDILDKMKDISEKYIKVGDLYSDVSLLDGDIADSIQALEEYEETLTAGMSSVGLYDYTNSDLSKLIDNMRDVLSGASLLCQNLYTKILQENGVTE